MPYTRRKQNAVAKQVKEDWKGYTFPGGHVEAGESFVDAVVREMKEETGLNITNPKLVGIKQFPITNGRYIVLLFKATEFSGTVISSDEGDMEWIDIDDISKVNVVEDFYDLLKSGSAESGMGHVPMSGDSVIFGDIERILHIPRRMVLR